MSLCPTCSLNKKKSLDMPLVFYFHLFDSSSRFNSLPTFILTISVFFFPPKGGRDHVQHWSPCITPIGQRAPGEHLGRTNDVQPSSGGDQVTLWQWGRTGLWASPQRPGFFWGGKLLNPVCPTSWVGYRSDRKAPVAASIQQSIDLLRSQSKSNV